MYNTKIKYSFHLYLNIVKYKQKIATNAIKEITRHVNSIYDILKNKKEKNKL